MAFDFPASPSEGQEFTPAVAGAPTYIYEAPRWKAKGAVSGVIVSDTPPASPVSGTLWYESDTGLLFAWVIDSDSSQWVQVSSLTPVVQDYIASTPANMYAGFSNVGFDYFRVNSQADGLGVNVLSVSDTGVLSTRGNIVNGQTAVGALPSVGCFSVDRGQNLGMWNAGTDILRFGSMDSAGGAGPLWLDVGPNYVSGTYYYGSSFVGQGGGNAIAFQTNGFTDAGNSTYLARMISGNPNYGGMEVMGIHVGGAWAGIRLSVAGGIYYDLDQAGTATKPGGGAWAAASDARIKDIQGDYTQGLDAVKALHPVVYRYRLQAGAKDEPLAEGIEPLPKAVAKDFIGLIAQEAEVPMPEMVTSAKGEIDGVEVPDFRKMDTTPLIYALVNAVKELSARIEALEAAA